ncbi:MAG: DUF4386 domain-containing protein [Rhodobacteraceae bacterium]|uniref:DUF4386 domain-containing protein n=2 Tax=unclassified Marivita TaxID=2632480 RepID=UPI000D796688|nr:DUF4386 domain-containing protein [Paracoccaceae bacterium]PWL36231.1 MAG: DUF4386 domain-containing protein [Marivita sp. XM-24bin2]
MLAFSDPNSKSYARMTGVFYLGIAVAGGFAIAYVPSQIIVKGDALQTVANILSRSTLYQLGITADLAVMLFEIMALTMLYFMFRSVSATLSFAAAMARLSMVSVMSAMLFFHAGATLLAETPQIMSSFTESQRAELAGLLLEMHRAGVWIWQVFFTLHLGLLGWLVVASQRFPRILGVGLMVGASGYLLDSVHAFGFPQADLLGALRVGLLVIVTLSEVGFALWLAIKGQKQLQTV